MIDLIKFLHLLFAIGLVGSIFFAFGMTNKITAPTNKNINNKIIINKLQKTFILIGILAAITGSLLIYPKNYSLHTHWIQAAYGLLTSCMLLVIYYANKIKSRIHWLTFCSILLLLLIAIIHDAVMKQTFLIKNQQSYQSVSTLNNIHHEKKQKYRLNLTHY